MDIIKNAHERTVMKEKLEEEKSKVVKEYVKKKNASARVSKVEVEVEVEVVLITQSYKIT